MNTSFCKAKRDNVYLLEVFKKDLCCNLTISYFLTTQSMFHQIVGDYQNRPNISLKFSELR